jgi:hypothetical protein
MLLAERGNPWEHLQDVDASGNKFTVSAEQETGNFVGRDNSGPQIIAHNSTINVAPSAPPRPLAPELAKPETVTLELGFELRKIVYSLANSAWIEATQFDYDARTALIVWFTNPVPPKGARGIDASNLAAHLKFSVPEHWSEQVKRAYWLGRSENRTNLEVGDRAGVIVGLTEWDRWVCYSNPYERPANEEFLQPALRPVGERKQMPKADMHIDLSLISNDSTTLEKKRISLVFTNGTPYAVVHP